LGNNLGTPLECHGTNNNNKIFVPSPPKRKKIDVS